LGRFVSAAEVAPPLFVEQNSDFQHMAQPGINAKLEELQFRLKTDPKSRLFFPLAEELRKFGKLAEAEQVLRNGLHVHAAYLSAWVSLGRVLREQGKNAEAVEALTTAMQVDPGNVVAARLLADAYLDLGEKIEAIKKYKLVYALMPSDEELQAKIENLDRDIRGPEPVPIAPEPEQPRAAPDAVSPFAVESSSPFAEPESEPAEADEAASEELSAEAMSDVADQTSDAGLSDPPSPAPYRQTIETPFDTGDAEPMAARHAVSPFEEPSGYTSDALEIEQPEGMHIEAAPLAAEEADPWSDEPAEMFSETEPAAEVFAPAEPETALQTEPDDDITATTTMADLYVRQGLIEDARKIYEHVLQRHPSDDDVRSKLEALSDAPPTVYADPEEQRPAEDETAPDVLEQQGLPKVRVLQQWLAKVGRREEGRV
jgi:tetratricopeptide (TPR) repeat protein